MSFLQVYGHEQQVALLKKSLDMNRIAQSYLFHGMTGVGKKTTALAFAKALICQGTEGETGEPCRACRKVEAGVHPDFFRLVPQGMFIKIDEIRELIKRMRFRPLEGKRRIVIIEDADSMNSAAANSLLKTLEEPLPGNVLILITSRHAALPGTILSRCQKIRFSPLPVHRVESYLREVRHLEKEEAKLLAALSGGCIGRILGRDVVAYRRFKDEIIEGMRDMGESRRNDPLAPVSVAESFGSDRREILEKLDLLKEWLRDVLVYREAGQAGLLMHADSIEATAARAKACSREDILGSMEAVERARRGIERNGNRQLILESMIFKLTTPLRGRNGCVICRN